MMDVKEAVKSITDFIRREKMQPAKAIEYLWNHTVVLDGDALQKLAKEGLLARVSHALTNGNDGTAMVTAQPEVRTVIRMSEPEGRPQPPQHLFINILQTTRFSVGEETKAIIHCTATDLDHVIKGYGSMVNGLNRRSDVLLQGKAYLKKYRVNTVEELPIRVQDEFGKKWTAVTKKTDAGMAAHA